MADSKEVATSDSSLDPEFIRDLLPSAERTALLYHLSYLCLGNFPKLERLLRERAVETQMLFGSSEVILMKCVGTSDNLVKILFPILMKAVELNKPTMAVKYLAKAREWIDNIIRAVDDIVNRYEQHNRSVATCTSDVILEKKETEKQTSQLSQEMESLTEAVDKLEEELKKNIELIEETERKIQKKNTELEDYIASTSRKNNGLTILAVLVPFLGPLIKSIVDTATVPGEAAHIQSLNAEMTRLSTEKINLQNKEWAIQVKQTDLQLQLSRYKIEMGVIPSPVHLKEVQICLSRIQYILIQLQVFWQKVGSLLDSLKDKTFAGEDLIEDLCVMKEMFLQSIETAGKNWTSFGECCRTAQVVFSIQSKDAYRFLETDPASLSKEEWEREYKDVMEKLNQISPNDPPMPMLPEGGKGEGEQGDHGEAEPDQPPIALE